MERKDEWREKRERMKRNNGRVWSRGRAYLVLEALKVVDDGDGVSERLSRPSCRADHDIFACKRRHGQGVKGVGEREGERGREGGEGEEKGKERGRGVKKGKGEEGEEGRTHIHTHTHTHTHTKKIVGEAHLST